MKYLKKALEFAIKDFGDVPLDSYQIPEEILEKLRRRMLDDINDQIARTCYSGHLHHTPAGALFCDAMKGYR